jgi:hypothetical protein
LTSLLYFLFAIFCFRFAILVWWGKFLINAFISHGKRTSFFLFFLFFLFFFFSFFFWLALLLHSQKGKIKKTKKIKIKFWN